MTVIGPAEMHRHHGCSKARSGRPADVFWLGTCGWEYPHWRNGLYPAGLPRRDWLARYATNFATVEVDTTFYGLPRPSTVAHWAAITPPDFRMAIKASRYLTHIRRLRDTEALYRLAHALAPLEQRRGPLLMQLPASARVDLDGLRHGLEIADELRWPVVLEARNVGWNTPACASLLHKHNATMCWTDWWGRISAPRPTARWGYVRLHAGRAHPTGAYGTQALTSWAQRLIERFPDDHDVYIMFNNDAHGAAPHNAAELAQILRHLGALVAHTPSRAPALTALS